MHQARAAATQTAYANLITRLTYVRARELLAEGAALEAARAARR
jgi:hypothetical protein